MKILLPLFFILILIISSLYLISITPEVKMIDRQWGWDSIYCENYYWQDKFKLTENTTRIIFGQGCKI